MAERSNADGFLTRLISAVRQLLRPATGRYQVTAMLPTFVGENVPGHHIWGDVRYLTPAGRRLYALSFRGGRIYDAAGRLFDTQKSKSAFPNGKGRGIFIMDADGNFFASLEHKVGKFHHSTLSAGAPVAAAGELEVVDGRLITLSDRSGHYRPAHRFTRQAIDQLKENHISFQRVTLDLISLS